MVLDTLELSDFRNYDSIKLTFNEGMNIIYGDNAQGKTNILEAIYVLATTKSHRTSNFKEMIRLGFKETHIKAVISRNDIDELIDIHYSTGGKKSVAINRQPVKKLSELFGVINVIMFSPEDLGIIKNGPAGRRRFLDIELCQVDKLYLYNLKEYHKVLKQRNNLLKMIQKDPSFKDQLDIWDDQLVGFGSKIIEKRESFISELDPIFHHIHYNISGERELAHLSYDQHVTREGFLKKLQDRHGYDIKMGSTSVGPHRDDISFILDEIDIRQFGSQGQQRTAALSLKLSEIELVKRIIEDTPILLLDDVLSELDQNRQEHLLSYLGGIQTLITCTGVEDFIRGEKQVHTLFHIEKGQVI